MSLPPDATTTGGAWPDGYERLVFAEVDSTNSEAVRLAPGLTIPTWIMAHRQTAARGRRGRAWVSPEGNFAASLVLWPDGPPAQAALRSFTAALALSDALRDLCGPGPVLTLKWPNDVLLNGGKVAGILLESAGQGSRLGHLVIGIGVNLVAAPPADAVEPGAMRPVAVLGETGARVSQEDVLAHLALSFARWEEQFVTWGFGPLRTEWLNRAARLGQPVIARTATETIPGTFEDLSDEGEMILATPAGRRRIPAAEIFF